MKPVIDGQHALENMRKELEVTINKNLPQVKNTIKDAGKLFVAYTNKKKKQFYILTLPSFNRFGFENIFKRYYNRIRSFIEYYWKSFIPIF